ncbi:MAG: M20/M25/M40 family metallo-hydrolase [Clostridia bacterium]|nr:M20/M25/M40 family metallo-hydrolase [Clostridia bacterium]
MDTKNISATEEIVLECTEFRKLLHQNAEVSGCEVKTKALLIDFLKRNTSLEIVDMGAWFYAVGRSDEDGADKKRIAFRADMDALPIDEGENLRYASKNRGVSHKCGHDGHSASLAALALYADKHPNKNDLFFLFQHAEETGAGAEVCCALIEKEHIDEIYGYHNMPGFPLGSIAVHKGCAACASKGIIIKLIGKNSHASQPENGLNPAFALSELILQIPALTSEAAGESGEGATENKLLDGTTKSPMCAFGTDGMVMCTVIGASVSNRADAERSPAFGTSAGTAELMLTVRAENEARMRALEKALIHASERIAKAHDLAAEIAYSDPFPETRNSDICAEKVRKCAEKLGLKVVNWSEPFRSSEDFGFYTKLISGALFYIGGGEEQPKLHTREYDFPDGIIPVALKMFWELAGCE